jgi:hypothetical protein
LVALQAVVLQTDPAQHWLVVAPHATQRLVPVWQTNGSPQNPPAPRLGAQHGWPSPPQATQAPFEQALNRAVQPTPAAQHGPPIWPHAPPWQPPALHIPRVPGQLSPLATHRCEFWSQHPPFWQTEPSQHGSPEPPQVPHPCGSHAVPDCVQKSLAFPAPFGLPGQQATPSDPQVPAAPPLQRF